jgi:diguanylate cyclase (GGDEF)-like protein
VRATFDDLTGCHDRASTMAALEAMVTGGNDGSRPAVIFVDLEEATGLHDSQGPVAGDELLGVVARRLHGSVRDDDLVGRMGGNQFLVVCPRITTAAEAVRIAIRIAESLSHEIQIKNARIRSRTRIGVAWTSGPGSDANALVAQADAAMRESKRRDAPRPVLFTPSLLHVPPPPG